eukprot:764091-Hanusia_phi.AAC.4
MFLRSKPAIRKGAAFPLAFEMTKGTMLMPPVILRRRSGDSRMCCLFLTTSLISYSLPAIVFWSTTKMRLSVGCFENPLGRNVCWTSRGSRRGRLRTEISVEGGKSVLVANRREIKLARPIDVSISDMKMLIAGERWEDRDFNVALEVGKDQRAVVLVPLSGYVARGNHRLVSISDVGLHKQRSRRCQTLDETGQGDRMSCEESVGRPQRDSDGVVRSGGNCRLRDELLCEIDVDLQGSGGRRKVHERHMDVAPVG